jgi:hypothetical protein
MGMKTKATMIGIVIAGVSLIVTFLWMFHSHLWQGLPHPEQMNTVPSLPDYNPKP